MLFFDGLVLAGLPVVVGLLLKQQVHKHIEEKGKQFRELLLGEVIAPQPQRHNFDDIP